MPLAATVMRRALIVQVGVSPGAMPATLTTPIADAIAPFTLSEIGPERAPEKSGARMPTIAHASLAPAGSRLRDRLEASIAMTLRGIGGIPRRPRLQVDRAAEVDAVFAGRIVDDPAEHGPDDPRPGRRLDEG